MGGGKSITNITKLLEINKNLTPMFVEITTLNF